MKSPFGELSRHTRSVRRVEWGRFEALQREAGLTQVGFARWVGVADSTVANWRGKDEVPRWAMLVLEQRKECDEARRMREAFSELTQAVRGEVSRGTFVGGVSPVGGGGPPGAGEGGEGGGS